MIDSECQAPVQDHQDTLESAMNKLNPIQEGCICCTQTKTAELHIQVTLLEAKGIVIKSSASALRAVLPAVAPAGYELGCEKAA